MVRIRECPWCGGSGKNPLYDVPDPDNCRVCYGTGNHISERIRISDYEWKYVEYDPRTYEQRGLFDEP
jgi:DnaJ-class molecular chaperone